MTTSSPAAIPAAVSAVLASIAGASVSAQVTLPDLVHRWAAEGTAEDAVGSADGVPVGPVGYVAGRFGLAFDLDPGEFITFGSSTGNVGTADFTISFWVRFDVPSGSALVTKRSVCSLSELLDVRSSIGGSVGIELSGDGSANYTAFFTTGSLTDGQWHHVAWRRVGLVSTSFIDGCLGTIHQGSGVADFSNAAQFTLGKSPCTGSGDGTTALDGAMDEIQIYMRALSNDEIALLAERSITPDLDGDGFVNGADLGLLLGAWGQCPGTGCCPADLDGDGSIDGADLGLLLGEWS